MEKKSTPRYFTAEEATRLVPELEQILGQLRALKKEIDEKGYRYREAKVLAQRRGEDLGQDAFMQAEAEMEFLVILAQSQVDRIAKMGALLKDIDRGLVDFPALLDGKEVLLCWQTGEPRVQYYHGRYEGFSGRKAIGEKQS